MKKLFLFDVDGTLTNPRQRIKHETKQFLIELRKKVSIGIISGSDYPKIKEQLDTDSLESEYDYVFCENGLVAYKNGCILAKQNLSNFIDNTLLKEFINFVLVELSNIDLPFKRGNFIEFRTGMINIAPCGRNVSQEERNDFSQYDKEHKIREKLVNVLKKKFSQSPFVYSIGGQISIDVFPKGWDKTFCLQFIEKDFDEIHFFGDNTIPGKNDYEIYIDNRTIGHKVLNPNDTVYQINKILDGV